MTLTDPRLPFEGLHRYLTHAYPQGPWLGDKQQSPNNQRWTPRAIGELVGTSRRNVQRWKTEGIPLRTAERITCHVLQAHVSFVWGDDYWNLNPLPEPKWALEEEELESIQGVGSREILEGVLG